MTGSNPATHRSYCSPSSVVKPRRTALKGGPITANIRSIRADFYANSGRVDNLTTLRSLSIGKSGLTFLSLGQATSSAQAARTAPAVKIAAGRGGRALADRVLFQGGRSRVDDPRNKSGLAVGIVEVVRGVRPPGSVVADVFAGTGAVASAFARAGYVVEASDHLPLCTVWAHTRLLGATATYSRLPREFRDSPNPLETTVSFLDGLPGVNGWVTRDVLPSLRSARRSRTPIPYYRQCASD